MSFKRRCILNVVHLSDTHFGRHDDAAVDALRRCLGQLSVELVIVSGDITQRAHVSQFKKAKRFFNSLPSTELICIPGNHDIPLFNLAARFFWPFYNYQKYLHRNLQPVYTSEKLWAVCLNTVLPSQHVSGRVSERQVEWVSQQLRSAPDSAIKAVVGHHPFAAVLQSDSKNIISGANYALEQWSRAGLDLVLGGHIHFPFIAPLNHHVGGLQGDPWIVQTGTATSTRVRNNAPNSFMNLQVGDEHSDVYIQRWDYSDEKKIFYKAQTIKPWS